MDVGNTWEYGNRTGFPSSLAEPIDVTSNSLVAPTRFEPALSCHPCDRAGPVRGEQASGFSREVDEGIQEGDRSRARGGAGPDAATQGGAASERALQEPKQRGPSTANLERSIGADHVGAVPSSPLCHLSKTVIPWKCSVEGESELESDERIGQALGGPAIEVVTKATRQWFTVGTSGRSSGRPTPVRSRTRSGGCCGGRSYTFPI